MPRIKKFKLGGVDLKSNDLVRDRSKASYIRNVVKTQKGDIGKRPGYSLSEASTILENSCYYKTRDQEVLTKTDGTVYKSYCYKDIQSIGYWSVSNNSSGALVTIAYVAGGTSGAEVVTVVGNAISISIESGVSIAANIRTAFLASSEAMALATPTVIYGGEFVAQTAVAATALVFTRKSCGIATIYPNANVFIPNRVNYTEYLNNLYFTTTDGKTPVVKFDGSNAYLAGMPAPTLKQANSATTAISISNPGTTYYFRLFYEFLDINLNITQGPIYSGSSAIATPTIIASTFKTGNGYGKFSNRYLLVPDGLHSFSEANPHIAYDSTNYEVGEYFIFSSFNNDSVPIGSGAWYTAGAGLPLGNISKVFRITAIDTGAKFITFDTSTFNSTDEYLYTNGGAGTPYNIDSTSRLKVFMSPNPDFGYYDVSSKYDYGDGQVIDNSINSITFVPYVLGAASVADTPFEDVYDIDTFHLRPPLCKYITTYGDQLVFGNIIGVWNQANLFDTYNNNDLVIYSDASTIYDDENGENHSNNLQKIGESSQGEVTGLSRCNDVLVVTKNNSVFALDGDLDPGGYTLRQIATNSIGCVSHNSILKVSGGVIFHGNDGIYFTDGVSCKPISDEIDPMFNELVGVYSRSTVNSGNKMYLFYVTDLTHGYILAFSYDYKEWLIWETFVCNRGLYEKNDFTVAFGSVNSLYNIENSLDGIYSLYTDASAAITSNYSTNWEDCGEPGLMKKFKYIRLWNLGATATTFSMAVQKNWTDTALSTYTVTVPAYSSVQKWHDQLTAHSIRYVFTNSTSGANMFITGYEIEFENIQSIDKGN